MRTVRFTVPTDTSFFTPLQLQSKTLLSLGMNAWARWARSNLVSFPRLVREHHVSLVIVGIQLEHEAPLRFFDAEELEVAIDVRAHAQGELLSAALWFEAAGREVVRGHFVMKPVLLAETDSLAATPGPLPSALLAKFQADEVAAAWPDRPLGPVLQEIEKEGRPIETREHPFEIHRSQCEVADQWSFTEIPDLAAASRESLALARAERDGALRAALAEPVRDIHLELSRPYYAFDTGQVLTQAYEVRDRLAFVHRFVSSIGAAKPHGVVVERF